MNQDPKFTETLQAWMNTPDAQKNWDEGAILLLQLSGNRIMYRNISVNPKGKAEFNSLFEGIQQRVYSL